MEEAAEADRIIVMEKGKIALSGTPEEIFGDPDSVKRLGLKLPPAVEMRELLRARGIDIPDSVLNMDGLARYLCGRAEPERDSSGV